MTPLRPSAGRILAGGVGLGVVGALAWSGGEETWRALGSARPLFVAGAIASSMLLFPLVAWRWAAITDALAGRRVAAPRDYLRARVLSAVGGFVAVRELAELGGRTLWLKRFRRLPLAQAAHAVVIDRVCDLVVSLAALLGALLYWFRLASPAASCLAMALFALGTLPLAPAVAERLSDENGAWARITAACARLPVVGPRLAEFAHLPRLNDRTWRLALLLSLAKLAMIVLRALLVAEAVGLSLSSWQIAVATPIGQLAYMVALTPGGLGIYEAGWYGVLRILHGEAGVVAAFVVLMRASLVGSLMLIVGLVLVLPASSDSSTTTHAGEA